MHHVGADHVAGFQIYYIDAGSLARTNPGREGRCAPSPPFGFRMRPFCGGEPRLRPCAARNRTARSL